MIASRKNMRNGLIWARISSQEKRFRVCWRHDLRTETPAVQLFVLRLDFWSGRALSNNIEENFDHPPWRDFWITTSPSLAWHWEHSQGLRISTSYKKINVRVLTRVIPDWRSLLASCHWFLDFLLYDTFLWSYIFDKYMFLGFFISKRMEEAALCLLVVLMRRCNSVNN